MAQVGTSSPSLKRKILITRLFTDLDGESLVNGYNHPVFLKLAIAFHTHLSELATVHSSHPIVDVCVSTQLFSLEKFISDMWKSLRALQPDQSDEFAADDSQLAVWTEISKIYCTLRR